MTGGARFALLAVPLLEMMVGGSAAGHVGRNESGHGPGREMHMDGVRFAVRINGLSSDGLLRDQALKEMVIQRARHRLVQLCEVDASAVTLRLLRGPTLVVGIRAEHSKVMEIRNMIHAAIAAPAHDSSITSMIVGSIRLVPRISEVREGQISAGPVQSWGPHGGGMGASLTDLVTILLEIKGLSFRALRMHGEVEARLTGKLAEMCAALSEVPRDQVVGVEIREGRDGSSVVASIDVLASAPHGEWLRRTIRGAEPLSHEEMLVYTINSVPQVERVMRGPIRAGELHVVPREDDAHHRSPPCECARVWKWLGRTFHGCAETPDWVGRLWCMTVDNDRCHVAMASTVETGEHWMECPNSHWTEAGGWARMWSEGDVRRSSRGEWHKEGGRMSRTSEDGHMREAHTKSALHGADTMESPAAAGQKTYSEKHEAGMRENSSRAGHQWMAGARHERHEHGEGTQRLHHGGVKRSRHSHAEFGERREKVTRRGPAPRAAGLERLVDCSMWERLLGGDACLRMHASEGEGRRLGATVFV